MVSSRHRPTAAMLALAVGCAACGGTALDGSRDTAFAVAVEASLEEEWVDAASGAHAYLKAVTADDERYDRAQMILAQSLEKLGLRYAASLYYLDVASARRNVEVLDAAFAGIQRIIESGAYDEDVIERGFVGTADITGLSPERQAFVDYHQGLESLRTGLDEWADQQFERIPRTSPYRLRALYAQAIRDLARGNLADGRAHLDALLEEEALPEDVRTDTKLALARLAMDEARYEQAVEAYEEVRELAPTRPDLLLEMAWAHFERGDSRRSLGLLVALDAPAYGGLIAPERYLLEASCLRRLCQFEPARIAAARLREAHGDALRDLHNGVLPMDSSTIRGAAGRRGEPRKVRRLVLDARNEREAAAELGFTNALERDLRGLYGTVIDLSTRRYRDALQSEVSALSEELLSAEDGVRLIVHELSVALLRGRTRPPGPDEIDSIGGELIEGKTSYSFAGEFWTDELDDLVVVIPDRCLE